VSPLKERHETGVLEGLRPSKVTIPERLNSKRELKRGFASLIKPIPLPLDKGKGIKGIGSK